MGSVTLVGAGPGDIGLLTCKGLVAIQNADCIIYDRLVDPQILTNAKPTCECIYVGKKASHHTLKQEEINELLLQKAQQYQHVVRLKGGDVFVFGRGGEEAIYLKENGISFDVIPGVSSSIAGLAYAGIPITHRGIASGFHVVSAHNKKDELADIHWESMLPDDQTYVFLMGLSKVKEIREHLLEVGKPKETPCALISNATLPSQDVIVSTLACMEEDLKSHPIASPAIIVVGNVVGLRKQLNFFEEKKLFHARVLLPKVGKHVSQLTSSLQTLGACVKEIQVSELINYPHALHEVCLKDYTYLIFTSKNAIKYFMDYMYTNEIDLRMLAHMTIVVIGQATKKYLSQFGIYADVIPNQANSETLYECLCERLEEHDKVLFPRVQEENLVLQKLKEHCEVKEITLYKNQKCEPMLFDEKELIHYDMLVFNCSSSVVYMMENITDIKTLSNIKIISIGETTSNTLRKYGITNFNQAQDATYEEVKNKIVEVWEEMQCIEEED